MFDFDNVLAIIKAKTDRMNYYGCEYIEDESIAIPSGITEEEYRTLIEALDDLIEASMSAGRMY